MFESAGCLSVFYDSRTVGHSIDGNHDLALALKGATEEVQNVILNNLSTRLASMIKMCIRDRGQTTR